MIHTRTLVDRTSRVLSLDTWSEMKSDAYGATMVYQGVRVNLAHVCVWEQSGKREWDF